MKDKKRKKIKLKKSTKIVLIILAVLTAIAVGLFAYVWATLGLIQQSDGEIDEPIDEEVLEEMYEDDRLTEEEMGELEEREMVFHEGATVYDEDVINILLLGTDERQRKFDDHARSDSMILVSLNFDKETIKMVSFQRGQGVPILRGVYKGQHDWLTHCFNYGGPELVMEEIEHCYGVRVDHFVRVNFRTFEDLVDSVGGVTVNVEAPVANALNGVTDDAAVAKNKIYVGENKLDGYDALQFARVRSCDSDWKRVERQRQVIQSLMNTIKEMSFAEMNATLTSVLPLFQTDMDRTEMVDLMLRAPGLISAETEQMTMPQKGTYGSMTGMGGRTMLSVDFAENAQILIDFLYN